MLRMQYGSEALICTLGYEALFSTCKGLSDRKLNIQHLPNASLRYHPPSKTSVTSRLNYGCLFRQHQVETRADLSAMV